MSFKKWPFCKSYVKIEKFFLARSALSVWFCRYRCRCRLPQPEQAAQSLWCQFAEWTAAGWPVGALLSAAPSPAPSPAVENTAWQDNEGLCLGRYKETDSVSSTESCFLIKQLTKMFSFYQFITSKWVNFNEMQIKPSSQKPDLAYLSGPLFNRADNPVDTTSYYDGYRT